MTSILLLIVHSILAFFLGYAADRIAETILFVGFFSRLLALLLVVVAVAVLLAIGFPVLFLIPVSMIIVYCMVLQHFKSR
jgi:hypothetical protein